MLKICKKIGNYKNERKTASDLIFIHFEGCDGYINGSKFIDKKSEQQMSVLKILLEAQCKSRLNGTKDIGCTWMKLASEIDLRKQKSQRKNRNIQTSEQHVRQLIFQIRKKAKEVTKDKNFDLINEAVKGRYVLNEKILLF